MIFSILVMGVIAISMNKKGYSFEKMLPYLLIGGIVAYFLPVGSLLALPFQIFGGFMGGIGGLIGGIFGMVGGLLGAVLGVVGTVVGLAFGLVGLAIGMFFVVIIPLGVLFVVYKIVT